MPPKKRKLLVVASALDLRLPFGCTPAWWFLLKALWAEGCELKVAAYAGDSVESPWWRTLPNPARGAAGLFRAARGWLPAGLRRGEGALAKRLVASGVAPRWKRLLEAELEREPGTSAVLYLSAPPAHLAPVAASLGARFSVPQVYYDGDAPVTLPSMRAVFKGGVRQFEGPELGLFDLVVSNSLGAGAEYLALGAKRVSTVWWGADPDFHRPPPRGAAQDLDLLFCGFGEEFRRDWMEAMLYRPARENPAWRVGLCGGGFRPGPGARLVDAGPLGLAGFPATAARSKIQACVTRDTHARVAASANARLFELACMGLCLVSNPVEGLARWFEEGSELLVLRRPEQAVPAYRRLLKSEKLRREMGRRARARVLDEHTTAHRARKLLREMGL